MKGRKFGLAAGILAAILLFTATDIVIFRQYRNFYREKSYLVAELQSRDSRAAGEVLNILMARESGREKDCQVDKEMLGQALKQNAYEWEDWRAADRDRQWRALFFWCILVGLLLAVIFVLYHGFRRTAERESRELSRLLGEGIPILRRGIEEESMDALPSYEEKWKCFILEAQDGQSRMAGGRILEVIRLQYRYSERERQRKQKMQSFVENVAHQWKTPLARMTLSLDMMTEENWQKKREQCLAEIQGLTLLVERLLNMARMNSGKVAFDSKTVELGMLLQDAGKKVNIRRNIQWVWEEQGEEYFIYGDEMWLEQAFFNLYENAARQMEELEEPHIITELRQEENGVRVLIEDEGQGLEEEEIEKLFHRFYTGGRGDGNSTGIGLSLACEIIRKHRGEILAYNGSRGAVFEVYLPSYSLKSKL